MDAVRTSKMYKYVTNLMCGEGGDIGVSPLCQIWTVNNKTKGMMHQLNFKNLFGKKVNFFSLIEILKFVIN